MDWLIPSLCEITLPDWAAAASYAALLAVIGYNIKVTNKLVVDVAVIKEHLGIK